MTKVKLTREIISTDDPAERDKLYSAGWRITGIDTVKEMVPPTTPGIYHVRKFVQTPVVWRMIAPRSLSTKVAK